MKPVCVPCQRFYRMKKGGYYFLEGMPKGGERAMPGTAEPERWTRYKLWVGDLWGCPDCGAQIVVGVGLAPLGEHYQEDFLKKVDQLGADQLLVKDC